MMNIHLIKRFLKDSDVKSSAAQVLTVDQAQAALNPTQKTLIRNSSS
jgi:hypothetical protein